MTYKEGQAVTYKPIGILGYIRRVNNRPQVNEGQQNYLVEVNGYLVTVYADQEDQYLAPAPPKPRPTAQEVKPATPVTIQDVKTGGFLGRLFKR